MGLWRNGNTFHICAALGGGKSTTFAILHDQHMIRIATIWERGDGGREGDVREGWRREGEEE